VLSAPPDGYTLCFVTNGSLDSERRECHDNSHCLFDPVGTDS